MKSTRLLSFIRGTLHFLEWMALIGACVLVVHAWLIVPIEIGSRGPMGVIPIHRFNFELPSLVEPLAYQGDALDEIKMDHFSATVEVLNAGKGSSLLGFLRWEASADALRLLLFCAIFRLLRKLFDNVKTGEAFSAKSVRLIQQIGLFCLVYAAVYAVVNTWLQSSIAEHLRQHVVTKGIRTNFYTAYPNAVYFSQNGFQLVLDLVSPSLGLLALALAEVFRQGLALREENDLTV